MANAPWRCSECGTINEPVANACRTCGRWPSLFDLEQSKIEVLDVDAESELEPAVEDFEVETFDDVTVDAPADAPVDVSVEPAEQESPSARRRRIFGSVIVPLAVVIYLVITFIVNR